MTSIVEVAPDDTSRLAEIGEVTALAYLSDRLVDGAHDSVPELKDAAARAADAILLMMTDGDDGAGMVVGTVTVVPAGSRFAEIAKEGEFELRMLAVSPIERGRGLGRQLAQAGIDAAVERGATRIVLLTTATMTAAHALYEHLGFVRDESLDRVADATGRMEPELAGAADGTRLLGYSWTPAS